MKSINKWFYDNIQKGLLKINISFLLLVSCTLIIFEYTEFKSQKVFIDNLSSLVSQGIVSNNRKMIESVFLLSTNQGLLKEVYLCNKDQVLISTSDHRKSCISSTFGIMDRKFTKAIPGMPEYKIVTNYGNYFFKSTSLLLFLVTLSFTVLLFYLIRKVRRRLLDDLIMPFTNNDGNLQKTYKIKEVFRFFDILRKNIEHEKKNVVLQAKSQIAAQVAHDIRSPLVSLGTTVNSCQNITEEVEFPKF